MINYFNFFRMHNAIMGALAVYIAYSIIDGDNIYLLFHCMLIVVLSMMFGNALNDILDLKSDNISHPNRPLPKGYIKISNAKPITGILFVLVICVSLFLPNSDCMYACFSILALLIFYNIYFKGIALIGNFIISLILASTFLFTELVFFNQLHITIVPANLIFGLSLIREILKDIHDYEGDKKYNIYTLPVQIGYSYSIKVVVCMIVCFCVLAFIPYYINYYSLNYLISLIILIEIPMIILLSLLLRNPDKLMISHIINFMKLINLFGLFVILIANK